MSKKISLKTSDNVEIIGNYYNTNDANAPAVVLLHMIPATKESWRGLAKNLNSAGFQSLAIDLRGHGESESGPEDYKNFSDIQHQASIKDVNAGVEFFLSKGVPMEKISLIGASIGANLSLEFQASHPEIKASVLLSPGLNYKGIETEPLIKKINRDQSIFLVAGGDNDEYSTETVQKLHALAKSENKQLKIFSNAGHGTSILREEPELMEEIVEWLKAIYKNV